MMGAIPDSHCVVAHHDLYLPDLDLKDAFILLSSSGSPHRVFIVIATQPMDVSIEAVKQFLRPRLDFCWCAFVEPNVTE